MTDAVEHQATLLLRGLGWAQNRMLALVAASLAICYSTVSRVDFLLPLDAKRACRRGGIDTPCGRAASSWRVVVRPGKAEASGMQLNLAGWRY